MEWTGALSSGTRRQIADALIDLQASSYNGGESTPSGRVGSGKKQADLYASNSQSNNSYLNVQEQDVRGIDGKIQMVTKFINLDSFEHMAPPVQFSQRMLMDNSNQ